MEASQKRILSVAEDDEFLDATQVSTRAIARACDVARTLDTLASSTQCVQSQSLRRHAGLMRLGLALILLCTATACGGGGGSDAAASAPVVGSSGNAAGSTPDPLSRPFTQSDQEIADLIYSGRDRTPEGFYAEPPPMGASYVTTSHLKSTDVDADGVASTTTAGHELCTDDWNQALEWSEQAGTRMVRYGDLVATNAEPRFFEFVRVPRENPTALVRQRVFKCAYLDRSAADMQSLDNEGGTLNRQPVTPADVRELAEYLWHFTLYNNFGSAVLVSSGEETSGAVAHGLTIASLSRAPSPTACDRIDVLRWTHTVDPATGAITRNTATLASLHARESDGRATLCSGS